jgi:hypothetical protein
MLILLLGIGIFVALLAVALWQVAPSISRKAWDESRPGRIWFHDSQGNLIPEDDEFKRPRNEGDLL